MFGMPTEAKILEGGTKDEMRISKEALFNGVSTQFYPSQTKILEGRTNISERGFEAIFNVL
jgi:hypothetical protein